MSALILWRDSVLSTRWNRWVTESLQSVLVLLTFNLQQYFSFSCFRKFSSSCRLVLSSLMSGCREALPMILLLSEWNKIQFIAFLGTAMCWHQRMLKTRCLRNSDFTRPWWHCMKRFRWCNLYRILWNRK